MDKRNFMKSCMALPVGLAAVPFSAPAQQAGGFKYGLIGYDRDGLNGNEELLARKCRVFNGDSGEEMNNQKNTGVCWIDDRDNKICTVEYKPQFVTRIFQVRKIEVSILESRIVVWF